MAERKAFHEEVAERLIEQLEAGTAPWQLPWKAGQPNSMMPMNPVTGNRYKGINAIHLASWGRKDNRWMTYSQANAAGAQVLAGERGTRIQFWKFHEDQRGVEVTGELNGDTARLRVALERPTVFFATVFNAEQIDGFPPLLSEAAQPWKAVDRAEQILKASGAMVRHSERGRAFYRPASDSVHLPERSQFSSAASYYATALHELSHWTGHESRLGRDLAQPFGSEGYAKEELRAEIASMVVGDQLGIGHDPSQHVAYVQAWIKVLENDPLEIFRAASDAERIQHFILGFEQQWVQRERADKVIEVGAVIENPAAPGTEAKLLGTVAEGLGVIDVNSRADANDRSARLARVHEERVARDPRSTEEDLAEAKEASKAAEEPVMFKQLDGEPRVPEKDVASSVAESSALAGTSDSVKVAKTYISVPFSEKDEARDIGARWDRQERSWYVPPGVESAPFAKWARRFDAAAFDKSAKGALSEEASKRAPDQREYLAVSYGERAVAKAAGAVWDKAAKSWYAGPKADKEKLRRWLPENFQKLQFPAMGPREEFAEVLRSLGCDVGGDHPIMDGQKHRIEVTGDKRGERAGFYVGHLDGHPAGYIKNNRTGLEQTWKSKGYLLGPEQRAALASEAVAKLQVRSEKQAREHEETAQRLRRQVAGLKEVENQTPYMSSKGILPQAGVYTDRQGRRTYVPAIDAEGKHWTTQCIHEDGTKRFAKNSRKEGCFHAIGGLQAIAVAPAVVIAEGYATAVSLKQSLGFATVAAFDSGNLVHVAKALRGRFPKKPIVIAGDDDRKLETRDGINPGKSKSEEAARAVRGFKLLPIFAPGEAAEGLTDFNDMATKSVLGSEGVLRQVTAVVQRAISQNEELSRQRQRDGTPVEARNVACRVKGI